jgi:hypothetical protein
MNQNQTPPKRTLTLTLNVIENRDSSFGNTKELAFSGTCTCTTTCCVFGGGGNSGGNDSPDSGADAQ